jgi:hypothetical protein
MDTNIKWNITEMFEDSGKTGICYEACANGKVVGGTIHVNTLSENQDAVDIVKTILGANGTRTIQQQLGAI